METSEHNDMLNEINHLIISNNKNIILDILDLMKALKVDIAKVVKEEVDKLYNQKVKIEKNES